MRKYKIINIHRNFKRNQGTSKEYLLYAELVDAETEEVEISSTLSYILEAIKVRKLTLEKDVLPE